MGRRRLRNELAVAVLLASCRGERSVFDVEMEDVKKLVEEREEIKVGVKMEGEVLGPPLVRTQDLSLSQALQFVANGWVILRNMIPGLRTEEVTAEARRAYAWRILAYADYAEDWMAREFDADCSTYAEVCRARKNTPGIGDDDDDDVIAVALSRLSEVDCCASRARDAKTSSSDNKKPQLPYFQALHVHRESELLWRIATSHDLGRTAAVLLQAPAVRLYQTNIVAKEPGVLNQETGIHRDLHQVPLDAGPAAYVTFWCPLERKLEGSRDSILHFYQGSHRDVSLHMWHDPRNVESKIADIAKTRYIQLHPEFLDVGDCTAHNGWLLHRAPAQMRRRVASKNSRRAITFSYVDADARVLFDIHGNTTRNYRPVHMEDELSFRDWFDDVYDPDSDDLLPKLDHPLLPVVYDERPEHNKKLHRLTSAAIDRD